MQSATCYPYQHAVIIQRYHYPDDIVISKQMMLNKQTKLPVKMRCLHFKCYLSYSQLINDIEFHQS